MDTERLYWENAYTAQFTAKVIRQEKARQGFEVVLDRTAFYPTGGGQPCDTGWLDGIQVTDVEEREGTVVHLLRPFGNRHHHRQIDWGGVLTTCSSMQDSTCFPPALTRLPGQEQ